MQIPDELKRMKTAEGDLVESQKGVKDLVIGVTIAVLSLVLSICILVRS